MRGQSEAVGLAVIMALVIGSILAYAFFAGPDPSLIDTDRILADNFAYVLLQSEYDTGDCTDRMVRILEQYILRVDPCDARRTLTEAESRDNITNAIESITGATIERWGLDYELRITDTTDRSFTHYATDSCPGFSRSGVAVYTFGRPERALEFAICS